MSSSGAIPIPPEGFTRKLVESHGRTIIRSRCNYCSMEITAPGSKSAWEEETAHRAQCAPSAAKKSAGSR